MDVALDADRAAPAACGTVCKGTVGKVKAVDLGICCTVVFNMVHEVNGGTVAAGLVGIFELTGRHGEFGQIGRTANDDSFCAFHGRITASGITEILEHALVCLKRGGLIS